MSKLQALQLVAMPAISALLVGCGAESAHVPPDVRPNLVAANTIRTNLRSASQPGAGQAAETLVEPTGFRHAERNLSIGRRPPANPTLAVTKDLNVCMPSGPVVDEIVIKGSNGGLANVLIFADGVPDSWAHETMINSTDMVEFDQKNCLFLNRIFPMQTTQRLKILNSDPVGHNADMKPSKNLPYNPNIAGGGFALYPPQERELKEERAPFVVSCGAHPWMKSHMIFRKNGYFAVTGEDGSFEIPNLPAGVDLKFTVWHEASRFIPGTAVQTDSTVAKNWTKRGSFTVNLPPDAETELAVTVLSSAPFEIANMNVHIGHLPNFSRGTAAIAWGGLLALCFTGCGKSEARFESSKLATRKIELDLGVDEGLGTEMYQKVADTLAAMFGTPDDPYFVAEAADGLLDIDNLARAAGPVTGDRLNVDPNAPHLPKGEGLYRQHCVHCHGVTGNGKGPTAAFLNPYPRDFTKGQFKFTSTIIGMPPTEADLHQILAEGIEGTAMPSFALLDRGEVEALVDYVKYLSVRGLMERALVEEAADTEEIVTSKENLVDDKLVSIVEQWTTAESVAPPEPNVPLFSQDRSGWSEEKSEQLFESIDRGRKLYYTPDANCFSCHGPTQLGDGNLAAYDAWAKELHNWETLKDEDGSKLAEHLALGGLSPEPIRPRNLRLGQYRGGRRPIDLYWRIHNGIDGTPMPNATIKPENTPGAKGLSHDDIWDLVNFVLSLPHEKLSRPGLEDLPTNERIRP